MIGRWWRVGVSHLNASRGKASGASLVLFIQVGACRLGAMLSGWSDCRLGALPVYVFMLEPDCRFVLRLSAVSRRGELRCVSSEA